MLEVLIPIEQMPMEPEHMLEVPIPEEEDGIHDVGGVVEWRCECGKVCAHGGALKSHKMSSACPKRPVFTCLDCGDEFTTKAALDGHKRKHSTKGPPRDMQHGSSPREPIITRPQNPYLHQRNLFDGTLRDILILHPN